MAQDLEHNLQEEQDAGPLKIEIQNVVNRYFAESARYFKKIQHGIRKGEAELLVICDGETPLDDDLKMVFEEHLGAVNAFRSWSDTGRKEAKVKLNELFQKIEDKKTQEKMYWMAAGAAFGALCGSMIVGGISGTVLGAPAAGVPMLSTCANDRKTPREKVMTSWEKTREAEKDILDFLTSLTKDFQNLSFEKALNHTQYIGSELNGFLLLLEERRLIFGPSSMMASTSRFPEKQRQYGNQRCEPEE